MQLTKQGRHYSSELIRLLFIWQMMGQSMYKKLKILFILPLVRRLQQLAQGTSIEDSTFNSKYFKTRVSNFTSQQRYFVVTLMIDEVYTAQRIEYSNGKFIDLTENGRRSRAVLIFMVHVVAKCHDVIKLNTVNTLTADDLTTPFSDRFQPVTK